MYISFISMNRMVEERAAKDDAFCRTLEQSGRPLLSHGRAMSDDALLAKLRSLGLAADRVQLVSQFRRFISAEAMARAMSDDAKPSIPDSEEDWVWITLTCLWERWLPEVPNFEMLDDKMQAGYAALEGRDCPKACRIWLEAWQAILEILERGGIRSLDAFDDRFGGTQSVFNWVQDLETELHNAGLQEPQFFRERIALCETMIARFSNGYPPIANFKTGLAESHFELGDREAGDRLFRLWVDENLKDAGSWIAWSDCYWTFAAERNKDAEKAERILKEGLGTPGVEQRIHLLERLAELYENTGRSDEAEAVCEEIKQLPRPAKATTAMSPTEAQVKRIIDFGTEGLPANS